MAWGKTRKSRSEAMTPEYWNYIRACYKHNLPVITDAAKARKRGRIDPYFLDWLQYFTPIEKQAWYSIRAIGVPLYPQFPALDYFIDFANPYYKIGLELDGKDFHDRKRDKIRDQRLFDEEGWRIFRATGKESAAAFKSADEFESWQEGTTEYKEAVGHWLCDTADGLIRSIDLVYFSDQPDAYGGLCWESLLYHRLANFELLPGVGDWR
jgi:hypothetical protein